MHADELNRVLEGGRSRREFLFGFGASLGSLAFSDLLAKDNPLAPGPPTAPAKAKAKPKAKLHPHAHNGVKLTVWQWTVLGYFKSSAQNARSL